MGDVYFEVSKHLRCSPYYVIKNKFRPDIRFLIMKYTQILRTKQKEYERIKEEQDKF